MNTAAKAIAENHALQGRLSRLLWGQRSLGVITLVVMILGSAFGVIYERNFYRDTLADFQGLNQSHHELALQAKQLQIEQSTWATQSRVQSIAERKLKMRIPDYQHSVMVQL